MALSPSQRITFKADAEAQFPALVAEGNDSAIQAAYLALASPDFWVWKTALSPVEYRSAIVWTEVDALTAGDARIFEWLTGQLTLDVNAADPNVRQGIADVFGAGTTSRTNLLTAARRQATRLEKLFATGTGSTASPATMVVEGGISLAEIALALRPPA